MTEAKFLTREFIQDVDAESLRAALLDILGDADRLIVQPDPKDNR